MLGKLFGSNARVKILKLFLLHPGEKYFIRQLARDLKLQVNSVRRELDNLESFGILISRTEKEGEGDDNIETGQEKKYYKVNTGFILFAEIHELIVKAQILYGQDFVAKIKKAGKVKLMVLAGAFVNDPEAIVDLLIVGSFDKNKLKQLIKNLEKELCREINFTLMDLKEFKYRREMTDVFLYSVLEGKRIIAVDEIGII